MKRKISAAFDKWFKGTATLCKRSFMVSVLMCGTMHVVAQAGYGVTNVVTPDFSPQIPSSASGTVDYDYYFSGISWGWIVCGYVLGGNVLGATHENYDISGVPQRSYDVAVYKGEFTWGWCNENNNQQEEVTLRRGTFDGITQQYNSADGADLFANPSGDRSLRGSETGCDGPYGCNNFVTDTYSGGEEGHGWEIDYTHPPTNPYAPYYTSRDCPKNGSTEVCHGTVMGQSAYYEIRVHLDQGVSLPSFASLGIPDAMMFSAQAQGSRQCSTCAGVPPNLVGWWQGNGNQNDTAGNNPVSQMDGASFATAEVGQGFSFDGNAHQVLVPSAPELNFGAGQDFSIELWVKPETSQNTYGVAAIVDKRYAPNVVQGQGYTLYLVNGVLGFRFSDSMSDVGTAFGPAGPDLRDGNFHHVAVTITRNSATGGHLYVDGQSVLTFDPRVEPGDLSNSGPLRIGNHATPGLNCFFKGIIDEVSLYNRQLSGSEIQSIFASGTAGKWRTCAPIPFNLAGWWQGNNDQSDSAGNNPITQLDGATYAAAEVASGFNFDGNAHEVIVPDAPELNFNAGEDFSVEAWIKPEVSYNTYDVAAIVDKRDAPNVIQGQGYTICLVGGALACRFSDSMDDVGTAFGPAGGDLRDGNFHHVALSVSRNSTTGGHLYVDGQSVLTFDPTVEPGDLSNTGPLRIGNHATPYLNCFFKGIIDEVSVYRQALSDYEVLAIFDAGASGKCK